MKRFTFIAWIAATAAAVAAISYTYAPHILAMIEELPDAGLVEIFFEIALICLLSFISFYLAHEQPLPSFVVALFLGIAAKPFFGPILAEPEIMGAIVALGATMILFQGGWETSFTNFRKLFTKISLLAFPGVVLTAVCFSYAVFGIGATFGIGVSITAAVLLGAVLASTDPAAIIPLLQSLKFKNAAPKDIVVSESAMNDVVGALLTLSLIASVVAAGGSFSSIIGGFSTLLTPESGMVFLGQLAFGVVAGVLGYVLLLALVKRKEAHDDEYGADAAYLLFVPIISFAGALLFGGSGYLAAFVAGLLFHASGKLHNTEHFYNRMIDGFAKPAIFLLLGALVDLPSLIAYAPVGIAVALVFIFVLRPAMVFLMLGGYALAKKMTIKELVFISWVRETGAIPAVLLVTVSALGLSGMESFIPIGMWVILMTLIVQPPLTPWIARKLGIAV